MVRTIGLNFKKKKKNSPLTAFLVKGTRQRHHVTSGSAVHWHAEHGGDLAAQHAGQLPPLLLVVKKKKKTHDET